MIKHLVLFAFKPEVEESTQKQILNELQELPARYPQMRNWSIGENFSNRLSTVTMTHAFAIDFDSERDLLAYLKSDGHENFVKERWRPYIERQTIVSYAY